MTPQSIVPEAVRLIGALVKPSEACIAEHGCRPGILVVMEYKVSKAGELVNFAGNPDDWFNLANFEIVSRK